MGKLYVKLLPNLLMLIKIVFDDYTFNWCETCKYNKIMALDSDRTLELF